MVAWKSVAMLYSTLLISLFVGPGEHAARVKESPLASEIVLVGTVHTPTRNFREETLVRILERIKPDLILLELDPSFFDSTSTLAKQYERISLESAAATAYAKTGGVKLRPYDIAGRNKFYQENDYFSREAKLSQEVGRLHASGQLVPEAKLLFETLLSLSAVRDACGTETLEVINSSACDTAVEKKQYYAFKGLRRIIELTPSLKDMSSFGTLADEFWEHRNDEMVKNILKHSRELRASRIVVLCGYEHRYYLKKRLAEQAAAEGFAIREYSSY